MGNKNTRPSRELDELSKTTGIEIEKLKFLKKQFPTTAITSLYLERLFASYFPSEDCQSYSNLIFNFLDEDKDGILSFQEVIKVFNVFANESNDEQIKLIFKFYDQDNDGTISEADANIVGSAIQKLSGVELDYNDLNGMKLHEFQDHVLLDPKGLILLKNLI